MKLADALDVKSEELAKLESHNAGKALKLTVNGDIPFAIDNLRFGFTNQINPPVPTATPKPTTLFSLGLLGLGLGLTRKKQK